MLTGLSLNSSHRLKWVLGAAQQCYPISLVHSLFKMTISYLLLSLHTSKTFSPILTLR